MRLGLFGGTFDPVHLGHLDVAHAARCHLSLDAVWFIPARVPPHRREPHASAAHRFAMVSLAVPLTTPSESRAARTAKDMPSGMSRSTAAFTEIPVLVDSR